MDIAARLTSKGQITIPKPVRDALKLDEGDQVVFRVIEGERAILARTPNLLELAGSVPVPPEVRGLPWDEIRRRERGRERDRDRDAGAVQRAARTARHGRCRRDGDQRRQGGQSELHPGIQAAPNQHRGLGYLPSNREEDRWRACGSDSG
jgi:AbrB family looped-hinge helix DNA binding protein